MDTKEQEWEEKRKQLNAAAQVRADAVDRVAKARHERAKAEIEFRCAVWDAHEAGLSFRDIAPYAELSHQRVHQIVQDKEW